MNGTVMHCEGDVHVVPAMALGDAGSTDTTLAANAEIDSDERAQWSALPDGKRSQLRALMRDLDRAVTGLGSARTSAVTSAVRRLAAVLDLGAEPAVVACPVCTKLGMGEATRCGYCWTALRSDAE